VIVLGLLFFCGYWPLPASGLSLQMQRGKDILSDIFHSRKIKFGSEKDVDDFLVFTLRIYPRVRLALAHVSRGDLIALVGLSIPYDHFGSGPVDIASFIAREARHLREIRELKASIFDTCQNMLSLAERNLGPSFPSESLQQRLQDSSFDAPAFGIELLRIIFSSYGSEPGVSKGSCEFKEK
jgi:hypothetical protein